MALHVAGRNEAIWSLLGEKRTSRDHGKLVVLDPERRFATSNCRIAKGLFDHLVGAAEHAGWNCEIERLRGLEIDHQLVFGRCLHW